MKLLIELLKHSSTIAKQQTLKSATALDRQVFRYAYDKNKTFGVTFAKIGPTIGEPNVEMFELLDRLANRSLSGHAAINAVEAFAAKHGDLIKLVCNQDLACGVAATTVNKAWPGLIPQFKVQLAKEVPIEKLKYPLYMQLKYDGVRIIITKKDNVVTFRTRNGKQIFLPFCEDQLTVSLPNNIMIDTEVTIKEGTTVDRTKVSGMINSARSHGIIDEQILVFNAFDYMPVHDFEACICNTPYIDRLAKLKEIIDAANTPVLTLALTWIARTPAQVNEVYMDTISQNLEGLILKSPTHLYSFKRSADWVKLKEVKTADLLCVDWAPGTGKYEGMIGALVCEGVVEGKQVLVSIGSGLTDADRADHPSDYLSNIIEVKYNSVIQDSKTGRWSLFLPRFVCVRFDK